MKPLILMLLIAISANAQSLADAARVERERQAASKKVHVFTTEEARNLSAPVATAPSDSSPAATPATPAVSKPVPPPVVKLPEDPMKKYADDLAKAKAKVTALQDQETAIQLQINNYKNVFLAPVTDQAAQAEAKEKLADTQAQLAATQKDLFDARKAAADLEAQGPPKTKP